MSSDSIVDEKFPHDGLAIHPTYQKNRILNDVLGVPGAFRAGPIFEGRLFKSLTDSNLTLRPAQIVGGDLSLRNNLGATPTWTLPTATELVIYAKDLLATNPGLASQLSASTSSATDGILGVGFKTTIRTHAAAGVNLALATGLEYRPQGLATAAVAGPIVILPGTVVHLIFVVVSTLLPAPHIVISLDGFVYGGSGVPTWAAVLTAGSDNGTTNPIINDTYMLRFLGPVKVGKNLTATFSDDVCIGASSTANGGSCVAVGNEASATGLSAICIGTESTANSQGAVAIGDTSLSSNANAIAIGSGAWATAAQALSLGQGSLASGTQSIAIGSITTTASGPQAIAIGKNSDATDTDAISIGNTAVATEVRSIAIGQASVASGLDSIAIGCVTTTAAGPQAVAIGKGAVATNTGAVSIGNAAVASGLQTVALGNSASSTHTNAVTVGNGSTSTFSDSLMLGSTANHANGTVVPTKLRIWNHIEAPADPGYVPVLFDFTGTGDLDAIGTLLPGSTDTAGILKLVITGVANGTDYGIWTIDWAVPWVELPVYLISSASHNTGYAHYSYVSSNITRGVFIWIPNAGQENDTYLMYFGIGLRSTRAV